jgi:ribonuclease HI
VTADASAGQPPGPFCDLDLLGDLQPRGQELRRFIVRSRKRDDDPAARRAVAEQLSLAVDAAFAGDMAAAAACLDAGDLAAGPWRLAAAARAAANDDANRARSAAARDIARAARLARLRAELKGEGEKTVTDTVAVINAGLSGRIDLGHPPDLDLVVASDGSYGGVYAGWAYVTSAGRWGIRAARIGGDAPGLPGGSLAAELLAAGMAAGRVTGTAVLVTDNEGALAWLARWRAGDLALPVTATKQSRRRVLLGEAAEQIRRHPGVTAVHVYGHRGHQLNEAADMLAKLARRWRAGLDRATPEEMTARVSGVCAAFLKSWYGAW